MKTFKFFRIQLFIPILLTFLILPAMYFFLKPGIYWNMHDDMQVLRQLNLEKCILDGQIPCRWVPDAGYEYGYPLFNFYPPLPYIVGLVFRVFGVSLLDSIKLVAATQIILTAFFMYLLCKSLTNRLGGILGSVLYTYAPYHAVNIYIRGAMNEAWASTFFPLVIYFILEQIKKPRVNNIIGLGLSFAAILLSHNPMALIFVPFCFLWSVYWLIKLKKITYFKSYLSLFQSAILTLGISAFFLLPVIFETKLVQVESMFSGYYSYFTHFATLRQLFISNFWGDGPSVWGTEDKMSFSVGYLHWIIPLFLLINFAYSFYKTKKFPDKLPVFISLIGLGYIFMAHERSTPLWQLLIPIQKIQFPWRFLNPSIFILSLSSVFLVKQVRNKLIVIALIFFTIFTNYKLFYPVHFGPITDQQKLSGISWRNLVTSGIYDYLPKTSRIAPQQAPKMLFDLVEPEETSIKINSFQRGTNWFSANVTSSSAANLTLSTLVFPTTTILLNGKSQSYVLDSEIGRPVIKINQGVNEIYFKISDTPIRKLGNFLSVFTVLVIFFLFFHERLQHRHSRN